MNSMTMANSWVYCFDPEKPADIDTAYRTLLRALPEEMCEVATIEVVRALDVKERRWNYSLVAKKP